MDSTTQNILIRYSVFGIAVVTVFFLPLDNLGEVGSWCVHHTILGIQCPLCGMTHAVHHLLHLKVLTATTYNFNVLFLPVLAVSDILWVWKKQSFFLRVRTLALILLMLGLGIIYIIRLYTYFAI